MPKNFLATRGRILKFLNIFASLALILNMSLFGVFFSFEEVGATANTGSIWTRNDQCGPKQNVNHYSIPDTIYIAGENLEANTFYNFSITKTSGGSPLWSGGATTEPNGYICFAAFSLWSDFTPGVYKVEAYKTGENNGKSDNFTVLANCTDIDIDFVCDDQDPCVDKDGDGYGIGQECSGPDCNDDNPTAYHSDCCYVDLDNDYYIHPYGYTPEGHFCYCGTEEPDELCSDLADNDVLGDDCDDNDPSLTTDCSACAIPNGIVINEIMPDPELVEDGKGEWFELYNGSKTRYNLKDCVLDDDGRDLHAIGQDLWIEAGGYLVLGNSSADNGGVSLDYVYSGYILGNSGDEIIINCCDTVVDQVWYHKNTGFPVTKGASMILDDPASDNNAAANWCVSTGAYNETDLGTPGAVNDKCGGSEPTCENETEDLDISALCSFDPGKTRNYQIYNPNSFAVDFSWEVVGDEDAQSGSGSLGAGASTTLAVDTIEADYNKLKVMWLDSCGEADSETKTSDEAVCADVCGDGLVTGSEECEPGDYSGNSHSYCDPQACVIEYTPYCEEGDIVLEEMPFGRLDLGSSSSEMPYVLEGWSDPWDWGGNYGGGDDGTFRLLTGYGDSCAEGYEEATISFNTGDKYLYRFTARHLDGTEDDSFDVYVNNVLVGRYTDQYSSETWLDTVFDFAQVSGEVEIKLVATDPNPSWCESWGQVAFSQISFYGFECDVPARLCGYKLDYGSEQGIEGWKIKLYEETECADGDQYADEVVSYNQGLQKNGSAVKAARSNPAQGLELETGKNESNFFSLGFGGWIVVGFENPIVNNNGSAADLKITEDTWGGNYPLEVAKVEASQDGLNWVYLGDADNTNLNLVHTTSEFDLDSLEWAKYVRITDVSDPDDFSDGTADGYDLNAVEGLVCENNYILAGDPVYTDENGMYCFDVEPGGYRVEEEQREDWTPMTPLYYDVEFSGEETFWVDDFVNRKDPLGSLSGCKYRDYNGNGDLDEGDEPIPGWEINLYECSDYSRKVAVYSEAQSDEYPLMPEPCRLIATTSTGVDGCYEFAGLEKHVHYKITENMPSEWWRQTYPVEPSYWYIDDDPEDDAFDFYNYLAPGCGNGEIEEGEECDDGNNLDGDGCDGNCDYEKGPYCGDGICEGVEGCHNCGEDCGSCSSSGGYYKYTNAGKNSAAANGQPDGTIVKGEEGEPVLNIEKSVDKLVANPGEQGVKFSVKISNQGNLAAFGVKLKEILDKGLDFNKAEAEFFTASTGGGDSGSGRERIFEFGDIEPGASKTVEYMVDVSGEAGEGELFSDSSAYADNHEEISARQGIRIEKVAVLAETGFRVGELALLAFLSLLGFSLARRFKQA